MSQSQEIGDLELTRMLDKTKSRIFSEDNSAFLGSILSSLYLIWVRDEAVLDTASTDYENIFFNVDWFLSLSPEARATLLEHELWHPALLHDVRRGDRCPDYWNYACDIRINNDLLARGRSFKGLEDGWIDPSFDKNGRMAEEDIYDELIKRAAPMPKTGPFGKGGPAGDLRPGNKKIDPNVQIGRVVRAIQQAEMAGQAGKLPGQLREKLDEFLNPKVNWRVELMQFFTDLQDEDFSWKRPNRRSTEIYLPFRELDEGRLESIDFFVDVSGSITQRDAQITLSEVRYIWTVLKPKHLRLIQFDTKVQQVDEFTEDAQFDRIEIRGRGGTDFSPVKEWIETRRPTAAVILSDMECEPMPAPSYPCPIIWAVVRNKTAKVTCGKVIYIKDGP